MMVMLDEYYRNGKLFIIQMLRNEDPIKYYGDRDSVFARIDIDDTFIKKYYRQPPSELLGSANVSKIDSEKDLVKLLGRYFEVSGKSSEILNASFFKTEKGRCSYCGREGEVFANRSYVFPFERKIDSIASEEARLRFCKRCGFTLYSGMAYLYAKGKLMFFFDSYNLDSLLRMNSALKDSDLRDPTQMNKIKKFVIPSFHPYETMLITLYEFTKWLKQKGLLAEITGILQEIRLILLSGSAQIYVSKVFEGTVLEKIVRFFDALISKSEVLYQSRQEEAPQQMRISPSDMIFHGFFRNLEVSKGNLAENLRPRDQISYSLLSGKVPFEALNKVIMERRKNKQQFPFYYKTFIISFLEAFGLDEERSMFEQINGLGYALGREIRGTNLESFIWDIFRARGYEDLLNSLAELQLKLKTSVDWRFICAYEKDWRKVKAILLNGMANAIYGGRGSE